MSCAIDNMLNSFFFCYLFDLHEQYLCHFALFRWSSFLLYHSGSFMPRLSSCWTLFSAAAAIWRRLSSCKWLNSMAISQDFLYVNVISSYKMFSLQFYSLDRHHCLSSNQSSYPYFFQNLTRFFKRQKLLTVAILCYFYWCNSTCLFWYKVFPDVTMQKAVEL